MWTFYHGVVFSIQHSASRNRELGLRAERGVRTPWITDPSAESPDMSIDTPNEIRPDVVRVQEELLDMLRAVEQDAPPPRREAPVVPEQAAPEAVVPAPAPSRPKVAPGVKPGPGEECPKCFSDAPWGNSSWCPECGYFPKAGFDGTGIAVEEEELPADLMSVLPEWVGPLAIGCVGLFVGSITSRFIFGEPLQRALVSVTQLLVCGAVAMAAHLRASYLCVQDGKSLMAVVNLGETWATMLGKAPKSKLLILLLGWGLAGAGSSLLIGMDVNLIAEEIKKEVADRPKVTMKDIMAAMTGITKKAFKGKNVMGAFGALVNATSSGGGGLLGDVGGGDGSFEGSIGDLAGVSSIVTDMSGPDGGGGGGGPMPSGDFEGSIGNLAGVSDGLTGKSGGGGGAGLASMMNSIKEEPNATTSTSVPGTLPGTLPAGLANVPEIPGLEKVPDLLPGQTEVRIPRSSTGKNEGEEKDKSKVAGTIDYFIYGYTSNPAGEVRSLLLAAAAGPGKLRYAQKLGLDGLSDEALKKITEDLKPFRSRSAAVSSPYGGKWVKPVVKCRVTHEGINDDTRAINPQFDSLILPGEKPAAEKTTVQKESADTSK